MAIPFTSTVLSRVVDKRRPVQTPIRNAHFRDGLIYGTPSVQLDILTSPEGLATAISHGVKSNKAPKDGWSTITVTIPRFTEHDIVRASDLIGLRAPGQQVASIPMMQRVNQKLDYIRARFDRTLEYMSIKALQGSVVDGAGNVIATYSVPAATAVVFHPTATVDNPIDVFDDAAVSISRTLGGSTGQLYAYCGINAYKYLRNEALVKTLLQGPAGQSMMANGEVAQVGGVMIRRLPNVYSDLNGVDQPFLADNEMIVASDAMDAEIIYGPCETPAGLALQQWFADTWTERDPPADYIRVETNPLPLITRPDSIRRYTVSNS